MAYPALSDDLAVLDDHLEPAFRAADAEALRSQKRFRSFETALIVGSVVAVALGAGAASPAAAGLRDGLLLVEGVLAASLTYVAYLLHHFRWHDRWLRQRAAAEALRGERFLFLARIGPYEKAEDPVRALRGRVAEIRREGARRGDPPREGSP